MDKIKQWYKDNIKKWYDEKMNKLSIFERFMIKSSQYILIVILIFKWFTHVRLTVMNSMKPEFKYKDYVVHEPM